MNSPLMKICSSGGIHTLDMEISYSERIAVTYIHPISQAGGLQQATLATSGLQQQTRVLPATAGRFRLAAHAATWQAAVVPHLRDGGPGGELLHALPHLWVCQHVSRAVVHTCDGLGMAGRQCWCCHTHHQQTESACRQAGDRQSLEIRIRAMWKGWKPLAEAVAAALTI